MLRPFGLKLWEIEHQQLQLQQQQQAQQQQQQQLQSQRSEGNYQLCWNETNTFEWIEVWVERSMRLF